MTLGDTSIDVDLESMLVSEAEDCERLTGWTVPEWAQSFMKGRARAVKFAYWLGLARSGSPADFASLDFDMVAMTYEVVNEDDADAQAPAALGVTDTDEPGPTSPEQEATPAE